MSVIAASLDVSTASQLVILAPLSVTSALLAGRCRPKLNLAFDIVSLVLSVTMAAVLFHAIATTQDGGPTGITRYAYYLTAGPMLLALWAADGLLHRLAVSHQARNRQEDSGSIAEPALSAGSVRNDATYPQLSRG